MVTVVNVTHPRARVTHRCMLCARTIRVGELYERQANIFEGNFYTWKSCAHCIALTELYRDEWWDDWGGTTSEDVENWEPSTIAGLRAKVMWRRRWTRRDGDLYDLPGDWSQTSEAPVAA